MLLFSLNFINSSFIQISDSKITSPNLSQAINRLTKGIFSKRKNTMPMTMKNEIDPIIVNLIQVNESANFERMKVKMPNAKIKENALSE